MVVVRREAGSSSTRLAAGRTARGATLGFGLAEAIGGSGFIAAFVGGAVFGGLRRQRGGEVSYLLEEAGAVLGALTFVIFGAVLLEPALGELTWQVVLYAVLSLTLVRMVPVAIAMLGTEPGVRPSASSAGSGREGSHRSSSRSSSWRRAAYPTTT